MKLTDYDYNLGENMIAKFPPTERGTTKLMVVEREREVINHRKYVDIVDYVKEGDVIVLNSTKVEKVRVFFQNFRNDRKIEGLFLNKVYRGTDESIEYWECILGRAKYVADGDILKSEVTHTEVKVEGKIEDSIFLVSAKKGTIDSMFMVEGHVPLPPYLNREDNDDDYVRYNTVFAKHVGSSAAPTSGLNITEEMLEKIKEKGAKVVEVRLNVGWGTFAPIRVDNIEEHKIHSEYIEVSKESADSINKAIISGNDVWAVGTTSARTLESVAYFDENSQKYLVKEFKGNTDIYIYPGYEWKVVNHMITNFHAPKSSLLVMISSFVGYDLTMSMYKEALDNDYKFLSYGDSMLII